MTNKRVIMTGVAALAALAIAAGCSSNGNAQPTASSTPAPETSATTTAAATQGHNQADVMFAHHMIPHHSQAIDMSDMLLAKQGIDPRVSALATQIKAAQGPEIEQMTGWLEQWGNPPMPTPSGDMNMPGMPGHGDMTGMSGAGMMSEQDMAALQNAQGVEASKLFLTQMITHHEGAITMAQTEVKDGQYPDAVAMAQSIITSQQQEIDTMNGILASL